MLGSLFTGFAAVFLGVQAASTAPTPAEVDAVVEPIMEQGQFPGVAVAVLNDGEPVFVGTYGYASLEHRVPVTTETVFELASLTKHMTALLVLELAEDGRLSLDDTLDMHLTNIPEAWRPITIDQLMAHMGGLAHRFEARPGGEFLLRYSTEAMLESAMATPMVSEPGTDWNYSDQGYFLLGLVIEAVTGHSFDNQLQATFFAPLEMDNTRMLDQSAIVPHRAEGYGVYDGELARNRRVWQFELTPHFGVTSSLSDLMVWERELTAPAVLNGDTIHATAEIQRNFSTGESCEAWGYARGWWSHQYQGRTLVSHAGYAGTAYIRDQSNGMSVIVLTNREDGPDLTSPLSIAWAVFNAFDPSVPAAGLQCWQ